MTVIASTVLGRPLWYELMTTDMAAAETFYRTVVGWTTSPFEGAPMPYTLLNRSGEIPVAGLMTKPDEVPVSFWAMYIGVPKVEDTAAKVESLGGSISSPIITVPGVGRMQMLADPQGAAFFIYEPENTPQQPEAAAEIGEGSWHELMTTDAAAALEFYTQIFGWQPSEAMDMGPAGKYYMFNRPHGAIGGMMNKPAEMADVPPNWQIYFRVPDVDSAVERITAGGGRVLNGPMEVPGGDRIVNAMDPQGAAFSLHARKAE